MVEKDRLVSEKYVDLQKPQNSGHDVFIEGDQTLSSFGKEERSAAVEISAETPALNSGNEKDKFNTLCDDVLTAHSMFDLYLTEMLTIKDELLKHSLPSNLLINLTLTCSKLYRSVSDLSTPTSELVRLVRLYSAQWEAKSSILKKIHDDYESKQRRLDIALRKLELVGVASAKSHGHRWKFLIGPLKEKAKTGEILSIPYPSNPTDDGVDTTRLDSNPEPIIPRKHRRNVQSLRHQSLLRREASNSRNSRISDDLQELENRADSDISSEEDPQMSRIRKMPTSHEIKPNFAASRFKSKYPFEKEAGLSESSRRFRSERVESPTGIRNVNSPRTPNRRFLKKNVSFFDESSETKKSISCAKEDKSVWTGEKEYDRFLHLRIYKPECTLVSQPKCTICLGEQVFTSRVYINDETATATSEVDNSSQTSNEKEYQEFIFTLPPDHVYVHDQGMSSIESLQLRIALQAESGGPMVAMSTLGYEELKASESVVDSEQQEYVSPKKYPMLSLVSTKETMFNSVVGHVPIAFCQTKKERSCLLDQSTQTLSFQELFDQVMEAKKKDDEVNGVKEDSEVNKIYTEEDFKEIEHRHKEEIEYLRNEYELQLQEIVRISMRGSPDGFSTATAEPKFLSACTSPIPQSEIPHATPCSRKSTPRPRTAEARTPPKKTKKIKTGQILPEWGKNLPENFFDRLEQFSRASAKYHQDLNDKTRKVVQENYELQMATQNRLSAEDDELDLNDVCLPALFMPSRMGTVYSPKASLYFHPSGVSKGRFTQAPSVFKLPSSVESKCSSVMNLFDISQNFVTNGPTWLSQDNEDKRPQSARTARRKIDKLSTLSTMNREEFAMKVKSE